MSTRPVALVVGAGDYIGAAIARRFAAGGFEVCLARRTVDALKPLADEIEGSGGRAHAFPLDARDEDQTCALFDKIERTIGPLDVVVFNVGGNVNFPIRDTTSRVFRKVWEMACFAGFLTGREAAKYMVPRGRGSIFFTGATASLRGGKGYAAFAAAKFGLRALAQSMARELGPKGVHVAHVIRRRPDRHALDPRELSRDGRGAAGRRAAAAQRVELRARRAPVGREVLSSG